MTRSEKWTGTKLRRIVLLNGAGAAAAAGFAALGQARPSYVEPGSVPTSLTEFWATSSALRTWAITVPLLGELVFKGRLTPQLLVVAGLVQLGDSGLGIRQGNPPMTVAPAVMALVHLASARTLWLYQPHA